MFTVQKKRQKAIVYDRAELSVLLNLYGRMVASGHWRDYALDHLPDLAIFSIYRHFAERPVYRIEKQPSLRGKNSLYLVKNGAGRILKRGNDLHILLRFFDRKNLTLIG